MPYAAGRRSHPDAGLAGHHRPGRIRPPDTIGDSAAVPAPADHSRDGYNRVHFQAVDQAQLSGNVETHQSAVVKIDTVAPSTTDNNDAAWHNTDYTVTLTPTDHVTAWTGSGVDYTQWRLNGGSWQTGTAGFGPGSCGSLGRRSEPAGVPLGRQRHAFGQRRSHPVHHGQDRHHRAGHHRRRSGDVEQQQRDRDPHAHRRGRLRRAEHALSRDEQLGRGRGMDAVTRRPSPSPLPARTPTTASGPSSTSPPTTWATWKPSRRLR